MDGNVGERVWIGSCDRGNVAGRGSEPLECRLAEKVYYVLCGDMPPMK